MLRLEHVMATSRPRLLGNLRGSIPSMLYSLPSSLARHQRTPLYLWHYQTVSIGLDNTMDANGTEDFDANFKWQEFLPRLLLTITHQTWRI